MRRRSLHKSKKLLFALGAAAACAGALFVSLVLLTPANLDTVTDTNLPVSDVVSQESDVAQTAGANESVSASVEAGSAESDVPADSVSGVEVSQATVVDDEGSYAAGEVLVTFDTSLGEDELRTRLAEAGVSVASVETVSTALEGNEVLVLVSYEGEKDAAEVSARLGELDFVSAAQPDYLYTLAEDDVAAEDDKSAVQAEVSEALSVESTSTEELVGEVDATAATDETDAADNAESVSETMDAQAEADEAGAQASTASVYTNDTDASKQWEHDSIGLSEAWDVVKCEGTVTVAVIDSGVDYDHPDLAANLLLDYAKNCHTDATGAAAVDDANGHGSHVAGIIAGVANNGTGIAGTSYNANILPIKVTYSSDSKGNEVSTGSDSGFMTTSDVVKALDYVVSLKKAAATEALANIRVVNLSLGGEENDSSFNAAVQRTDAAGIVVVAAAGNYSSKINGGGDYTCYPAAYDNVIAVGNLYQSGTSAAISSSSNKGSFVDISAPGTNIYSTIPSSTYGKKSGTSMAAPVVSAVAALVCAADAEATTDEVESILTTTALDLGTTGRDNSYGYGEVQAYAAVAKALGMSAGTSSESGGGTSSTGNFNSGANGSSNTYTTNPATPTAETQAMYRLYNPNSGEHFYTASSAERDYLVRVGWNYEGVGWYAPKSSGTPVYRMYNKTASPKTGSGEHHYTTSAAERDSLVASGWTYEGVGWYSADKTGTQLYRVYNPNEFNNNHHYTTSATERDNLISLGWDDEGIAWYGV